MKNEDHGSPSKAASTSTSTVPRTTYTDDSGFLGSLSPTHRFTVLSFTMIFLFSVHNVLQEAIMRIPDFKFGVMLGYMEVCGVTLCSTLERRFIAKETGHAAPLSHYTILTLCLLASSGLSGMSLDYINFPTKVVFRSCKLIPTMLISTCVNRRTFSSIEYACAFAICAGLVLFAAADWKLTPIFHWWGILLVSLSVVADAILPNCQERLFRLGSSRLEVTFYTNFFTLIAMTMATGYSGDLPALWKLATSSQELAYYLTIYTLVSYAAISAFMVIVKEYGGVTAVLLTTARKAMTIALSFFLFPKAFSWMYVAGALFVLGGLTTVSLVRQAGRKEVVVERNIELRPLMVEECAEEGSGSLNNTPCKGSGEE